MASTATVPGKAAVYRIFDRVSGDLLYVGCTNNIRRRMREHHDTYVYRLDAVRYQYEWMGRYGALSEERRLIQELNPRDNQLWIAKRDMPQHLAGHV